METKQCTKCLEHKPADHTHFSPSKNGLAWQSWCRACHREIGRARSAAGPRVRSAEHKQYVKEWQKGIKEEFVSGRRKVADGRVCTHCDTYKTKEHFYRIRISIDGLSPQCKECRSRQGSSPDARETRRAYYPVATARRAAKKVSSWAEVLYATAKLNHKRRNISFTLPSAQCVQELWEKQGGKCYWYGIDMVPSVENKHPAQPSLERLDNSRSYEVGNVVLSCWAANAGRGSTDLATWTTFCQNLRADLPH